MAESLADRGTEERFPADFTVGAYLVLPQVNRLVLDQHETQLEPKAMEVLLCLARHPGQVVSRQELIDLAWDGSFVTDDALTQAIVQLRRAFEDSAESPHYIETIRKKGYRLVADVEAVTFPEEAPEPTDEPAQHRSYLVRLAATAILALLAGGAIWSVASKRSPISDEGLTPVPMTTWPGLEGYPAPSPDGSRVAFSAAKPGSARYDLFMKQPGSDSVVQLTNKPGHVVSPTWSPDGRSIAFARRGDNGCRILRIPALGGNETLLRPCGPGSVPLMDWSPDGQTLAISTWTERGSPYRIELYDFESGLTEVVTDPPHGFNGDRFPEFHPSGESIVFRRSRTSGVSHLHRLFLENGELERITRKPGFIRGVTWTPDGEGLVFGRQFLGVYQLAWISADGRQIRQLPLGTQAYFPIFGASGLLAFITRENRTNFWQLNLGAAASTPESPPEWIPFAHSSRTDWSPAFSPNGDRLAFASDRNGEPGLWLAGPGGEQLEELLTLGGSYLTHPSWSPDGGRLAFEARTGEGSQIHIFEIGSDSSRPLTSHDSLNTTPTWSRDGRRIYFGSDRSGTFELWAVDLEASPLEPRQVTASGGYLGRESLDGNWLYYSKRKPDGLWRRSIDGGPEEPVLPTGGAPLAESWELTDSGVYYIQSSPRELLYFDFVSGGSISLGEVPANSRGNIALDPAGQRLILQFREWVGADVYTAQWPRP